MNFLITKKKIKKNIFKKENIYFLVMIIAIFFLDRVTKLEVINNFNENTYYINNYINLDLIWNIGIGFGLLSTDSYIIYNFVTVIISLVLISLIYLIIKSENSDKFIFSIIVGGALGNYYDRLTYKAVPDFIDLHFNNFHWFTFNVADIFITLGILVYLGKGLFIKN